MSFSHWRISSVVLAATSFPLVVAAQPALESLWPNIDGLEWNYEYVYDDGFEVETGEARLYLDGTDEMAGATVQRMFGDLNPVPAPYPLAPEGLSPVQRGLWLARPELRDQIEQLATPGAFWPFQLLAAFDGLAHGVGFLVTSDRIGGWRDMIADWSWWFLTDDLLPGAMFRLQLLPDITDDLFLDGTVRTISGTVTTPAGTFDDAVIVDYLVDFGTSTIIDDNENEVGTVRQTLSGWVAYVPTVGPVAHEEAFEWEVDCPTCPPDLFPPDTFASLSLLNQATPTVTITWGGVKARWR